MKMDSLNLIRAAVSKEDMFNIFFPQALLLLKNEPLL